MKVFLEGSKRHHKTGGVLHQKDIVNLFTHTVEPHTAVSYFPGFSLKSLKNAIMLIVHKKLNVVFVILV